MYLTSHQDEMRHNPNFMLGTTYESRFMRGKSKKYLAPLAFHL